MNRFDERRRARAELPGLILRFGEEPPTDDRDTRTVDERLARVRALTRPLWSFTGRPIPDRARESGRPR